MTDLGIRLVTWIDAFTDANDRWMTTPELADDRRLITSVGFAFDHIDGYLSLAQSLDPGIEALGNIIHIPKVNVVSDVALGVPT